MSTFKKLTVTPKEGLIELDQRGQEYKRSFKPEDLMNTLGGGDAGMKTGLLPPAVRWVSADRKRYVVERPPTTVSIMYAPVDKYTAATMKGIKPVLINIPWQVYLVDVASTGYRSQLGIHFAKSQIRTMDHPLFSLPLPNVGPEGAPCLPDNFMGNYDNYRREANRTIAECIEYIINYYWTSGFNENYGSWDYVGNQPASWARKGLANKSLIKHLESLSTADVLEMDWKPYGPLSSLCTEGGATGRTDQTPFDQLCSAAWSVASY